MDDDAELAVLFVAAMGGLGGPVKRLATLLRNVTGVRRILIKPKSELLDRHLSDLGSVEEHIEVRRSAQRSYLGAFLLATRIFIRVLSRKQPIDVIHANGIVEFALCWPAAILLRKPVVTWVGNYEPPVLVKRFGSILRSVSRRTQWNAVSSTAAQAIVDSGLANLSDVKIVTNIVDPADVAASVAAPMSTDPGLIKIGYLQVAQDVKGFDLLPKVISDLSDLHHDVQFLIFTTRNSHTSWKELDALPPEVVQVRPRTANVGDIYAECDIVFSPSRLESFNRVVAEALMTGTPVVASDLEPVRDVVGDAGLFFPVGNVSAASECLRQLIQDSELRDFLGHSGRIRSRAWLPGPVAEEFVAQYRSAAEPSRNA